jgi:hypothetical protein
MSKLAVLLFCFFSWGAVSYTVLPRPADLPAEELNEFNVFTGGLDRALGDYYVILPNKDSLGDYSVKRKIVADKGELGLQGVMRVPDSQEIRQVFLVGATTKLKQEPGGKDLKVSYDKELLVLSVREKGDWKFITDGQSTGWILAKHLKAPPTTVYVEKTNLGDDGEDLKAAVAKWQEHLKVKALEAQLAEAHPACPTSLTPEEEDGLVALYPVNPSGLRSRLFVKCGTGKDFFALPKVKSVRVKKADCSCLDGDLDGYKKFKISPNFGKADPDKDCRIGRGFVICTSSCNPAKESECEALPTSVACPKDCLTVE